MRGFATCLGLMISSITYMIVRILLIIVVAFIGVIVFRQYASSNSDQGEPDTVAPSKKEKKVVQQPEAISQPVVDDMPRTIQPVPSIPERDPEGVIRDKMGRKELEILRVR